MTRRLPDVKTLYELLPKGTEGGKEFARIVDLLLFHEARRAGKTVNIFSDSAGDYFGLDSFNSGLRRHEKIGYQYKFYPSPLSNAHRKEIEKSLLQAAEGSDKKTKLTKWILVTPQDMVESATRKDGGDVSWFAGLKVKLNLKFELEHWGHKKLIGLFLDTPALCLFYYPELVPEGATRKRTISDLRKRYDKNLVAKYQKIEFVGMSVYKQEATRGVPMEDIYIPLQVIPEAASDRNENVNRINPVSLLNPGERCAILGDPGSGKSTLQKFLALGGISDHLQKRYELKSDPRISILVTLRRYADELKSRRNLSLLDYILETVRGDFSLPAETDFLEYYLESGQAILLFDGLDELPNPEFKQTVRDRIRALTTTYPGNTTIVTSRIVGYDNPFRFDEKEFSHYKLARLRLPEIERFVDDWYRVRIEDAKERDANVKDLIRILRNDDHTAIRELAENPLLLTIITLVHRIDAVLPDERVVLYQKCTETLLNTWHTWKYRGEESRNKGKVERRNRRRIEVIANWMHCRSIGTKKTERAVAPYKDLRDFLANHIEQVEKANDPDKEPVDLADEFLEFVRKRAGLLIEVGDQQYSFVHQTFQEYLTSSHIITTNEAKGVDGIWQTIRDYCNDPRWQEVIRLLIADLKSDESQQMLIQKILDADADGKNLVTCQLLGGLLLDGIEAAETYSEEILKRLLWIASRVKSVEKTRAVISTVRACLDKDNSNEALATFIFQSLWAMHLKDTERLALILIAFAARLPEEWIIEIASKFFTDDKKESCLLRLLLTKALKVTKLEPIKKELNCLKAASFYLSVSSSSGNFIAATNQALIGSLNSEFASRAIFSIQMYAIYFRCDYGAFHDLNQNLLRLSSSNAYWNSVNWNSAKYKNRSKILNKALTQTQIWQRDNDWGIGKIREQAHHGIPRLSNSLDLHLSQSLNQFFSGEDFWLMVINQAEIYETLLETLCQLLGLTPIAQWQEALRIVYLPRVPQHLKLYNPAYWNQLEKAFVKKQSDERLIFEVATLLLLDVWFYVYGCYVSKNETTFGRFIELTRNHEAPALRIAHCIRDLAYGDESRTDDLAAIVKSDDPEYRAIFEECLWRE